MLPFTFVENLDSFDENKNFVAILDSSIKTKEELLIEIYKKLQFPDYFGFNWDALLDCLKDLHWISKKKIVLVHEVIPRIEKGILLTYLEILSEVEGDWKRSEERSFEVLFPKSSEEAVKLLLKGLI